MFSKYVIQNFLPRLSLFLLGLMVSLPFLQPIHHPPIPSFYEEWLVLLLGVSAMLCYVLSQPKQLHLLSILWLPGALLLASLLQLAVGMIKIPMLAWFQSGFLLWAMALICLVAGLRNQFGQENVLKVLTTGLLAGALVSACIAYTQRLELSLPWQLVFPSRNGQIWGNLGQRNLLTTQLWLGIISLICLHEFRRVRLIHTCLGLLVLASACGLTASRMSWLHGLMLLLLAAVVWRTQVQTQTMETSRLHRRRILLLTFSLVCLIIAGEVSRWLPWHYLTEQPNAFDRLRTTLIAGDARLDLWRDTLTMIQTRPWLGGGVGNYPWNNILASALAPEDARSLAGAEHAHNFLLQIAADFGLPLTLAITLFAVIWLWRALRNPLTPGDGWVLALLAPLALHSQLEYPLWHGEFLGVCAVLLGLFGATSRSLHLRTSRGLVVACLAALAILGTLFHDYRTLDQALIVRREVRDDKTDWRRRMDVFVNLSQHSILGPYARSTLAVLMRPDPQQAADQSLLCEPAMQLRIAPELMAKCAVLRRMTGKPAEAQALLDLTRRAFRDKEDRDITEFIWNQQGQQQP